jgi:hypothetical protein
MEPADDAAVADRTGRRNVVIAERRHDRAKHRAGVLHYVAREVIEFALRPVAHADSDFVGTDKPTANARTVPLPSALQHRNQLAECPDNISGQI